eukprot:snap_masked-scaffold_14-processed-gene-5.30-mRNA-1 protein AED:1.00 eAED:1.00 QI:0/-1/0/0/-1/1/1/0/328
MPVNNLTLSRQTLKLDLQQYANLRSIENKNLFLIIKPNHAFTRQDLCKTLHMDVSSQITENQDKLETKEVKIKEYSIGRGPSNSLVINDMKVSTCHLKIYCYSQFERASFSATINPKTKQGSKIWYFVEDCSTNGTWIHQKRMKKGEKVPLTNNTELLLPVCNTEKNPQGKEKECFHKFVFQLPDTKKLENISKNLTLNKCINFTEKDLAPIEEEKFELEVENKFNSDNMKIIDQSLKFTSRNKLNKRKSSPKKMQMVRTTLLKGTLKKDLTDRSTSLVSKVYVTSDELEKHKESVLMLQELVDIQNDTIRQKDKIIKILEERIKQLS